MDKFLENLGFYAVVLAIFAGLFFLVAACLGWYRSGGAWQWSFKVAAGTNIVFWSLYWLGGL